MIIRNHTEIGQITGERILFLEGLYSGEVVEQEDVACLDLPFVMVQLEIDSKPLAHGPERTYGPLVGLWVDLVAEVRHRGIPACIAVGGRLGQHDFERCNTDSKYSRPMIKPTLTTSHFRGVVAAPTERVHAPTRRDALLSHAAPR